MKQEETDQNRAAGPRRDPEAIDSETLLQDWRVRISRSIVGALSVICIILMAVVWDEIALEGFVAGVVIFLGMTVLALFPRIPQGVRTSFILLSTVYAGVSSLLMGKDPGGGAMYFTLGIILTLVLTHWRYGLFYLAFAASAFGLASYEEANHVQFLPSIAKLATSDQLASHAVTLLTVGTVIILSLTFLMNKLRVALDERSCAVEELLLRKTETETALAELLVTHANLETSQTALIAAGRAELLGHLAGGIAHDMNNALTIVLGEADLLEESNPEAASSIHQAVGHATHLTRQILALGKKDIIQAESLQLAPLVDKLELILRRTLPQHITLVSEVAEAAYVFADPNHIQQILLNLATNAAHAMPQGGTLSINIRLEGHLVTLKVSDTGVGMDQETRLRIFEPFFSTKEASEGTGLGLASVITIVQRLDGEINCTSRVGEGTCFTITLPALEQFSDKATSPAEPLPTLPNLENLRILVVDDDARIRGQIVTALEKSGSTVRAAVDAASAISLVSSEEQAFDLVCSDVVMPQGGGIKLMEWMSQNHPQTPIVICTGYSDNDTITEKVARGDHVLLRKPFTRAELYEACRRSLASATRVLPRSDQPDTLTGF